VPAGQIATPGPPGSNICAAGQYTGGQTVIIRNLEITLPAGGDYQANFGIADPGGEFVRVCYVQGNSATFNLEGRETSRVVNDPTANAVLDQVAASVRPVGQATATPSATHSLCTAPANTTGGQTIGSEDSIRVTLPSPGDYSYIFIPVGGPSAPVRGVLSICHIQTDSRLGLSADTCLEVGRTANNAAAHAIFDQITASASCAPLPAATAAPVTPQPDSTSIQPPEVGDAGLK
jgi:hypothetical protein